MRYNNHASARKLPNGGSENDFFLPLFSLETPPAVWSTAGGVFRGKASPQSGSGEGALFRIPGAIRTHGLPLRTRHGIVAIHDLFWNRTILRPYIHFYSRNYLHMWWRVWHNTRHSVSKPPKNWHLAGFPNCIGVYDAVSKTAWRRPPVGRHAFNCWEWQKESSGLDFSKPPPVNIN